MNCQLNIDDVTMGGQTCRKGSVSCQASRQGDRLVHSLLSTYWATSTSNDNNDNYTFPLQRLGVHSQRRTGVLVRTAKQAYRQAGQEDYYADTDAMHTQESVNIQWNYTNTQKLINRLHSSTGGQQQVEIGGGLPKEAEAREGGRGGADDIRRWRAGRMEGTEELDACNE